MCFFRRKRNKKETTENAVVETQPVETASEPETVSASVTEPATTKKSTNKGTTTKKSTKSDKAEEKETKPAPEKAETAVDSQGEDKEEKKKPLGKYVVTYDKDDKTWKIKRDGAKRVIDSKPTKKEAMARVLELSGNQDVGFVAKKKNGQFQSRKNINAYINKLDKEDSDKE